MSIYPYKPYISGFLRKEHAFSPWYFMAKNRMSFHHPVKNTSIYNFTVIHYGNVSIKNGHQSPFSPFPNNQKWQRHD